MRPKLHFPAFSESIFAILAIPLRFDPIEGFAQGGRKHHGVACKDFVVDGKIRDFLEESVELLQAIIRAHL